MATQEWEILWYLTIKQNNYVPPPNSAMHSSYDLLRTVMRLAIGDAVAFS